GGSHQHLRAGVARSGDRRRRHRAEHERLSRRGPARRFLEPLLVGEVHCAPPPPARSRRPPGEVYQVYTWYTGRGADLTAAGPVISRSITPATIPASLAHGGGEGPLCGGANVGTRIPGGCPAAGRA